MRTTQNRKNKPLVVLVYEQSLLRLWMEKALGKQFRVCVFANAEDAIAFVRVTQDLDILVTDLDLGASTLGGCNIARDVAQRFPGALIFVFSEGHAANDYRLVILQRMKKVHFLSKFEALLLDRRIGREYFEK